MSDNSGRATKRKSLLSELGIKPGESGAPISAAKPTRATAVPNSPITAKTPGTTRATTVPAITRRASVAKPSSPSVSRSRNSATSSGPSSPTTTTRKTPPATKADRASKTPASPTSPSPRRRSIVPNTSNPKATASPLSRRSSVNITNTAVNNQSKRISSPAGLESLAEVQTMKEQLLEKEEEVKQLQANKVALESENEAKIAALETDLKKVKEELMLALEKERNSPTKEETEEELADLVSEAENRLKEAHESEMKNAILAQERKLEAELIALKTKLSVEYEEMFDEIKRDYIAQIDQLKQEHEKVLQTQKREFEQKLESEKQHFERQQTEQESTVSKLKDQIKLMEEMQTNSHVRKVQKELEDTSAALEEYKRMSQQNAEALERRYREEIRQLQNGSDDTAEAWLEKTRSAQQKLDQLHDQLRLKEQEHNTAILTLKETHEAELDKLHEICENKEAQIEEQSAQIEDLSLQVENLQNSLEAATIRLEHTAKASPSSSSGKEDINNTKLQSPIKDIHQECLRRIDDKQKELDELKSRLINIKETHELQINRLGQEKAAALKTISSLEQKLAATTPPQSPTRPNSMIASGGVAIEERIVKVAEQHRKEVRTMQNQYQMLVDAKDRELEDFAYRIKALVAAKQKAIERLQDDNKVSSDRYERELQDYETKINACEDHILKLKEKAKHWETLTHNNEVLLDDLKKECTAYKDENAQLVRLVNQLQSEIHPSP
ncbi:hypothetical protein A0J61_01027 [Choanephora cucurbitarum]|uniref:Uncharacterized protein n=1 Tax=Choanephora cucurbitarum TaxID=101091 RepID=A0A1C7NPU2_9FUNG|nr:hypothetical protein A0J61_01027 [Choanephora cucurbitarum]